MRASEEPLHTRSPSGEPIHVALVGYGYWGRILAREISADPRFALVLVVDPLARGDEVPAGVRLATDVSAVLADDAIEAAFVATPVATHFELCRTLLGAGRHVFCEKPLVRTVAELDELRAIAARMSRVLFCDYVYLGSPSVRQLLDLRDELGEPSLFEGEVSQFGNFYPDDSVLDVLGVHLLSVLAALLGPLDEGELRAALQSACVGSPLGDGRLGATVSLRVGRTQVRLECDLLSPTKTRRIKVVGERGSAAFSMTDPSATLSWALFEPAGTGFETVVERSVALDESHGVAGMLDWFHEAIRSGEGSASGADGVCDEGGEGAAIREGGEGYNIAISRTVTMLLEALDDVLREVQGN